MSESRSIKVLVADEDPLRRRAMRDAVRRHGGLKLVAETGDGWQAVRLCVTHRPDVAVLSVGLPERSGLEVAGMAEVLCPDPPCSYVLVAVEADGWEGHGYDVVLRALGPDAALAAALSARERAGAA